MNDSRDQFFNNLFDENADAQTHGFQRQLSYENRIVRRAFNECGVKPPSWGRIINMCRAETGAPELSFSWFNSTFRRFPGKLCGKRIGYCGYRRDDSGNKASLSLYQLSLAELLATKHNILLRTIAKAIHAAGVEDGQPFIFVFPLVRRMFCAHNLGFTVTPTDDAPSVRWVFNGDLVVESSASAFRAIGPEWFDL